MISMKSYTLLAAITSLGILRTGAATLTFGPVVDFKGVEGPTAEIMIPTSFQLLIPVPFDGFIPIRIPDRRRFEINRTANILAAGYATITTTVPGAIAPEITLTDIWAQDRNPGGKDLHLAGFDPEIVPLSPEEFIGHSGTVYTSFLDTTSTVGNLSTLLPGFDLSAFEGDPNAIVYVSQTLVPVFDAVPETAEYVNWIAATVLCLMGIRWRRRAV
jgi:hypothetical protein